MVLARERCVNKINSLRATLGRPPLQAWDNGMCVDQQAQADQDANRPHASFGQCMETAGTECITTGLQGLEACLDQMWNERNQPGCAGCDACATPGPGCPNCDFYGSMTGNVCGDYVNLSTTAYTQVVCGFSADGRWILVNLDP